MFSCCSAPPPAHLILLPRAREREKLHTVSNTDRIAYKKYALFFATCLRGVESWMVDLSESVVNNERGPLTQLT